MILSSLPIAAVILMLFAERAKVNSIAVLFHRVIGLAAVLAAVFLLMDSFDFRAHSDPWSARG